MAPVLAKMVLYDALHDPKFNLVDFARMNDALQVQAENRRRQEAAEAKK
jgi:hypothetical protein